MKIDRRAFLTAASSAGLAGCALPLTSKAPSFQNRASLAPLDFSSGRLMRITVCTRPFRTAGPRLEAEAFGGKRVVHNYGHGGSGWSLSWGCAQEAAALALAEAPGAVAVIGAGVMGLTTALRLIESGVSATIYAKDFPAETRSARASGVWSPSSRIALDDAADDAFASRWETWARRSYRVHQHYIGTAGTPVEFLPHYALRDAERGPRIQPSREYAHLGRRLRDIIPRWSDIDVETLPFPVASARGGSRMTFNVASYADRLTRDFLLRGGRMVRKDFPDLASVLALREPVIVNCTGYGAKQLWGDDALAPVRGQIGWFEPQSEARYGVNYRDVSAVSRRDGLIVQYLGPNEDWGYGDDTESQDAQELLNAVAALQPIFQS
ncbi:MAG: FAD-dependent oxidoreductase [Pseudomonadota bacterium]